MPLCRKDAFVSSVIKKDHAVPKAHDVSDFTERIIKIGNYDVDRTDFYAVLRYLGLMPYQGQALPNGAERTPVSQYLSYSHKLLESIGWSYSTKR